MTFIGGIGIRDRRKETLRSLEKARRIYEIESTQRVQGQQVLSRWVEIPAVSTEEGGI
jgi:hypothetical protein